MEKNRQIVIVLTAFVQCVVLNAGAKNVEWSFPREGCCHEGLAFADARTGVLAWGGGDTLKLTVGRADLWDHRGGYAWTAEQNYTNILSLIAARDAKGLSSLFSNNPPPNWGDRYNPYMLPLGRVAVKIPGAKLLKGALDTSTGLGWIEFSLSGGVKRMELAMSKQSRAFALRFSEDVPFEVAAIPAMTHETVRKQLKPRGFAEPIRFDGGFRQEIPEDRPVTLAFKTAKRELIVATSRGEEKPPLEATYAKVAGESTAFWQEFWRQGARVKVPDDEIQEIFDYGMYRFGAMTDPDGVPAGLQGPWLEDDKLVPWNGDYHFNINVQECYSPAFRGGHFKNLLPMFRMILSWRPRLRDNARKFVGIDSGYVLPHSVDDRGVCIGGFWTGTIDHASAAWMASMMFRYVRYSGDVGFLKEGAYDFMKGAMNVYRAMMEERNGALSLPVGPSPEWGGADVKSAVGRDPSFQLAAAHRLAKDLTDAAKLLGEQPQAMWLDVEKRLPRYSAGSGGIQLFEGQPLTSSHRHHSHLAGIYPFDVIDFSAPDSRKVVAESYNTWIMFGTGWWTGWCVPWASIIHTRMGNAEAAAHALKTWRTFFNNPGHGSLHDAFVPGFTRFTRSQTIMQMDGQCAAATAVMEMMAHEVNGKTRFFSGCPEAWREVSFENLALSDGTRVSGKRVDGKISVVKTPQK